MCTTIHAQEFQSSVNYNIPKLLNPKWQSIYRRNKLQEYHTMYCFTTTKMNKLELIQPYNHMLNVEQNMQCPPKYVQCGSKYDTKI